MAEKGELTAVEYRKGGSWCRHGHEYTPENTRLRLRNRGGRDFIERVCRQCRHEKDCPAGMTEHGKAALAGRGGDGALRMRQLAGSSRLVGFDAARSPCWELRTNMTTNGYSRVNFLGVRYLAHRLFYQEWRGSIAEGLTVDHLCRNRCCINPAHLDPVSLEVNLSRGHHSGRLKTECPHGHPYSGNNLTIASNGNRRCRECNRIQCKRRYDRRKERDYVR